MEGLIEDCDVPGRIGHPHLNVMDKGFEISYTEYQKDRSDGQFDPPTPHHREFGYSDDQFEKVMEDFKKIVDFYRSESNRKMKAPPEIGG